MYRCGTVAFSVSVSPFSVSMYRTSIACIALYKGKILIARRNPAGDMGSRWEFPGGKVEEGETDEQAVVREFHEEFGIFVTAGNCIAVAEFEHSGYRSDLHAYRVFVPHDGLTVPYTLTEHTEYRWVLPDMIPELFFVDSDMSLYPEIKKYLAQEFSENS